MKCCKRGDETIINVNKKERRYFLNPEGARKSSISSLLFGSCKARAARHARCSYLILEAAQ